MISKIKNYVSNESTCSFGRKKNVVGTRVVGIIGSFFHVLHFRILQKVIHSGFLCTVRAINVMPTL